MTTLAAEPFAPLLRRLFEEADSAEPDTDAALRATLRTRSRKAS